MPQRILVVDDDKNIVRLVQAYLLQSGYQVLTAYNGETALQLIRSERPDLIILDLMLPDHDGWEITKLTRSDPQTAQLPIIMLTARIEDTDTIIGLELGADDYITKPFNPRTVVARIRAVLRRTTDGFAPRHILLSGALQMDLEQRLVTINAHPIDLTPTEFAILQLMMENPGRVFTRAELIEKGLGYIYTASDRTLDSHIKNLRKKIEPDPTKPTYIQTVYGVGYKLHNDR